MVSCLTSFHKFRNKINDYLGTDVSVEGDTLNWNKIPKYLRLFVCINGTSIAVGTTLVTVGVINSNIPQIIVGGLCIVIGIPNLTTEVISSIKRYRSLRQMETEIESGKTELVTLREEISTKMTSSQLEITCNEQEESLFLELPPEILLHVFTFLSAKELLTASKACTKLCLLVKENSLWGLLIQKDYPEYSDQVIDFRQKYKEAYLSEKYGLSQRSAEISKLQKAFLAKETKKVVI